MIHFLITIERTGMICDVRWSQPAYIVPAVDHSFFDLFSSEERPELIQLFDSITPESDVLHCGRPLSLVGHGATVRFCVLPLEETRFLVFGADTLLFDENSNASEYKSIINRFMQINRELHKKIKFDNSEATRYQFENIQFLNNELTNTRRNLEKANAQLKRLNEDLSNRLVKDALTGLVSRYQYRAEIELAIKKNPGKLGVFTFVDIDAFKQVNDTFGHRVGDGYLIAFADRLRSLPFTDTILMRISGDEFGLFTYGLPDVNDEDIADLWAALQTHVLREPVVVETHEIPISISAGMAVFGIDTEEIYDLIEYADFAMYQAKRNGKNRYSRFDPSEYEREKGEWAN
jgi:diguanylate cyclase (GGDEF)-like protein